MKQGSKDDMTMDVIMRQWPAAIRVILDHGLLCIGCPIAPFHTIVDACREYDVDTDTVLAEMRGAIAGI